MKPSRFGLETPKTVFVVGRDGEEWEILDSETSFDYLDILTMNLLKCHRYVNKLT